MTSKNKDTGRTKAIKKYEAALEREQKVKLGKYCTILGVMHEARTTIVYTNCLSKPRNLRTI